ncbi:MAG TPA: TonB-dependent receptor [Bacteroidales bacterium]|nr:TonB-dependent receptor [Bacteroidales bacterium]HRZ49619.1 TonB-dependent receptor [Bacteroidales bacterium]
MQNYFIKVVLISLVSVVAFHAPRHLMAQSDTLMLKRVVVTHLLDAEVTQPFDSMHLALLRSGTLSELLAVSGPMVLKDYGPGQISTPSFRGAGASQTSVVWNGMRISNPMLSQFDLSLVPAGFVDGGGVVLGPATLRYGSGAAGGVIDLVSDPAADSTLSGKLELQGGSFGYLSGNARISFKIRNLRSVTRAFRLSCDNRYPYADNFKGADPFPVVYRENAFWREEGLMQQLVFERSPEVSHTLHLWLYRKFSQVPYPIQQPQGTYRQEQSDEGVRVLLENRYRGNRGLAFHHLAGFQDGWMHYVEERSATDALHHTRSFQESVTASGLMGKLWVTTRAEWEWQSVHTEFYSQPVSRTLVAGFAEVSGKIINGLQYRILNRIEWEEAAGLAWMPSAILTWIPPSQDRHRFSLRLRRDRRLPGLNDLYWYPGGNPLLGPERNRGAEIRYETTLKLWDNLHLTPDITMFMQQTDDKIIWLPDSGVLWQALNMGTVRSTGITPLLKGEGVIGRINLSGTASYQYSRVSGISNDPATVKKQLAYQPYHCGVVSAIFQYRSFTGSWDTRFTGKRYTNADNTAWLNGYSVSGLRIQYRISGMRNLEPGVTLSVHNLFNRQYQSVAWYPMPGRYFRIGITLAFKPTRGI